jgi:hypothetical protein
VAIHSLLTWLSQPSITIRRHIPQHAALGENDASFESNVFCSWKREGRDGELCRAKLWFKRHTNQNLKSIDPGVSQSDRREVKMLQM